MRRLKFVLFCRPFQHYRRTFIARSTSTLAVPERVQQTLDYEILAIHNNNPQQQLILGVSGGCDSVALLHILTEIHQELQVVHFDHQQRGNGSDGDREFVASLCQSLRVPLHVFYWNETSSSRAFSQDKARQWRRQTMRKLALDNAAILVTAHHKDDSDETILLKLLRGVHISNLSGLSALSRDKDGVNWARPLIHVRKHEIVDYLQQHNLTWREDASNQSNKYLRNRVRNELIPLMNDMVGTENLQRRLENLEQQSSEVREDLQRRTQTYLDTHLLHSGTFLLPDDDMDLVAKEALYMWVSSQQPLQFTYDHFQRVVSQIQEYPKRRQWRLNIGNKWDIERQGDALRLRRENESIIGGTEHELEWRPQSHVSSDDATTTSEQLIVSLPVDVPLNESLRFVSTSAGRKLFTIIPPWRQNPSKVSEFLRGQGVPLHQRSFAQVIALDERLVAVYVATKNEWIVDVAFVNADGEQVAIFLDTAPEMT